MGWIILGIFIAAFCWLLFAPIRLDIDSDQGLFRIQWWGIGTGQLQWMEEELVARVRLFFWTKTYYLLRPPKAKKKKPSSKVLDNNTGQKTRWTWQKIQTKGWRLLRSFRWRFCYFNFDSNDYVRNAYLFPLFQALSGPRRQLQINFQGVTSIRLQIDNRLLHILYALLF